MHKVLYNISMALGGGQVPTLPMPVGAHDSSTLLTGVLHHCLVVLWLRDHNTNAGSDRINEVMVVVMFFGCLLNMLYASS